MDSSRGFSPQHANTARAGDPDLRTQNDGWVGFVLSHPFDKLRAGSIAKCAIGWAPLFRAPA